jgi:hypothetical protein
MVLEAFDGDLNTLLTLIIPLVSALVGWGTNVLALHVRISRIRGGLHDALSFSPQPYSVPPPQMTFYPIEFIGIWKPYIGWQGIIPMKAREMTERACDLITERLLTVSL